MSSASVSQHVLIFARDDKVGREIRDACKNFSQGPFSGHVVSDLTRAIDITRDREPDAALIDLSGDLDKDRVMVQELRSISPNMMIVGVYSAEGNSHAFGSAFMVELVRLGVSDFLRRPIADRELQGFFQRLAPTPSVADAARLGTCIAFISNKGGVGKSTLAVNLATSLAMRFPGEVLLIDASLQMGVCAPMLNLNPETSMLDAFEQRQRLDSILIRQLSVPHESGLLLLAAPSDPISAADIDDQAITRVLNLARRTFRFVVVDTFPLFDQIVMSVLDIATRNYLVLDNVVPTVLSGVHLLRLLDSLEYPHDRLRVVVNRYQQVPGNPMIDDIARSLRMPVEHILPYDKRAITAANIGKPFAMSFVRWSKLHRAMGELRDEVLTLSQERGG